MITQHTTNSVAINECCAESSAKGIAIALQGNLMYWEEKPRVMSKSSSVIWKCRQLDKEKASFSLQRNIKLFFFYFSEKEELIEHILNVKSRNLKCLKTN